MNVETILFILVGAVALIAAIAMVVTRNMVHSALFMVVVFSATAVLYLIYQAPVIAMLQIAVYAGGIMVLFLFVIMLIGAEKMSHVENLRWQRPLAFGLMAVLVIETIYLASTGGWTIGSKSPVELYASTPLFALSEDQQRRLDEVAQNVFRPCCNNPTHFPDCNHGMAMLGLLELMASQNATVDEMFTAAKHVNAFWYPQQSLEQAVAFKAAKGLDYNQIDSRELTGAKFSSGTGFQGVHQWLANNGLLQQGPGGGNNCGV